jgi:hypothetical protein
MIARWLEVLASFNLKVLHRAGASHDNADTLSRIEHAEAADPEGADSKSVLGIHPPFTKLFRPRNACTRKQDTDRSRDEKVVFAGQVTAK